MNDIVLSGDKIYARNQNELQDNVDRLSRVSGKGIKAALTPAGLALSVPQKLSGYSEPAIAALAYNASGGDLKAWQPVTIIEEVYSDTAGQFRRVLIVDVPVTGDEGKFAVCAAPIPANGVGRVYISGVCKVMLSNSASETRCDISNGNAYLLGNPNGTAQIISEDSGGYPHLALIRFPFVPVSSNARVDRASAASTANVSSLTGLSTTVDGVALNTAGMLVLLKDQTTGSQNGLYSVASGAWTKLGQPDVLVDGGTANAKTLWLLTAANTYSQLTTGSGDLRSAKCASTVNLTLSGTQTIDGISAGVGDKVLAKNQTTASQNGLYTVASGAWTKIGQPDLVGVLQGTASSRGIYMLTSANTYQGAVDFWG